MADATQVCTLYGVEGSYYTAKIRAYLVQKEIPFREVRSDRRVFAEVIIPRVGYPVIPVVVTPDDEILQDTADMIDSFEARHAAPVLIPATPRRRMAAYLLELYADEWLKLPALYYRWHYDSAFAIAMMGRNNDPDANPAEQRRVGAKIAREFQSWPAHLGATEATRAAIETSLLEFLALLEAHFAASAYVLGAAPTLADCALMGPLYAHLYHDPHSGAILRNVAPNTCAWIARMRTPPADGARGAPAGDEVPASLVAVMRHLARDYVPVLTTAMPLLQAWLGARGADDIPRYAGRHRFTIGAHTHYAAEGLRSIHPFEQWKLQRVLDVFASFAGRDETAARDVLERTGAAALLTLALPQRLVRRGFRLTRAG